MGDDSLGLLGGRDESGEEEEDVDGGEQESGDDDSSNGETFFLDPAGRVPFAGDVSFDFRSAPQALTTALSEPDVLAQVVRDCQTVFSARAKKLEYSTGETFWMQADAVPRNCLERLALDIFEAHTPDARFDRPTSGAEWWTQVIDESDDIGWHWDKDYGMEAHGINVHPCLATVTYLSTKGGPTIILEKTGPMACEDVRGVSGESARAWISRPSLGKHICFDGRYLHAAPADLAVPPSHAASPPSIQPLPSSPTSSPPIVCRSGGLPEDEEGLRGIGGNKRDKDGEPKPTPPADAAGPTPATDGARRDSAKNGSSSSSASGRRVTFLVNVWLNHTPKTAAPLPGTTAAKLTPARLAARLAPADFVPPSVLCVREEGARVAPAVATIAPVSGSGAIGNGDIGDKRGEQQGDATGTAEGGSPQTGGSRAAEGSVRPIPEPVPQKSRSTDALAASAVEAAGDVRGEVGPAVDTRWEFGEVGDEAEKHLRHEVLVPVPAALLPSHPLGATDGVTGGRSGVVGGGGGSFCVEFLSSRRPRVSRIDTGGAAVEEESSSEESEEDEESAEAES